MVRVTAARLAVRHGDGAANTLEAAPPTAWHDATPGSDRRLPCGPAPDARAIGRTPRSPRAKQPRVHGAGITGTRRPHRVGSCGALGPPGQSPRSMRRRMVPPVDRCGRGSPAQRGIELRTRTAHHDAPSCADVHSVDRVRPHDPPHHYTNQPANRTARVGASQVCWCWTTVARDCHTRVRRVQLAPLSSWTWIRPAPGDGRPPSVRSRLRRTRWYRAANTRGDVSESVSLARPRDRTADVCGHRQARVVTDHRSAIAINEPSAEDAVASTERGWSVRAAVRPARVRVLHAACWRSGRRRSSGWPARVRRVATVPRESGSSRRIPPPASGSRHRPRRE